MLLLQDPAFIKRAIFFIVIGYSIYEKCSRGYVDWLLVLVLVASVYLVLCHGR